MLVIALTLGHLAVGDTAQAQGDRTYQVKITNLTQAQSFTPILLAAHSPDVRMFFAGTAASPELQALAETGNTAPLAAVLAGLAGVSHDDLGGPALARRDSRVDDHGGRVSHTAKLGRHAHPDQ